MPGQISSEIAANTTHAKHCNLCLILHLSFVWVSYLPVKL
jgi:hypothetical protein